MEIEAGYDKKTATVDIQELVKSLGYRNIYLVGHDIGLMVAYAYAAQFPMEVRSLRCWTRLFPESATFGKRYTPIPPFGIFIL